MSDIGQEEFRVELDGGKYVVVRLVGGGSRWFRHGEEWHAAVQWKFSNAVNAMVDRIHELETRPPALAPERSQGDGRKAHYGDAVQPWDTILASGWGPAFAASNVVKYLRRTKNPEHSLESARWYYARLVEGIAGEFLSCSSRDEWLNALDRMELILTKEERVRVRGG